MTNRETSAKVWLSSVAGGALILILAVVGQPEKPGFEPSTGSTAVVLTEYASATTMPLFAMMPEAATLPECPAGSPTISTPDGSVTCCSPASIVRQQRVGPPQIERRVWDCPVGWRVTIPGNPADGFDPGPQRVVPWVLP